MPTPYYQDDFVTLYHGDALLIAPDLVGLDADVVLTDPPYGMNYESGWSGAKVSMDGTRAALRMYRELAPSLMKCMADDAFLYWFTRWDVFADSADVFAPHIPVTNMLVWDKGHPGMGNLKLYGNSHELIMFGVRGKKVLTGGRPGSIMRCNPVPPSRRVHPTEKPLELLKQVLTPSNPRLVFDPFAGSGSSLVAARAVGAKAVGIELDERHAEAAAKRVSTIPFGDLELDLRLS